MTIQKISGEEYGQLSKAQLALHTFVHTQKYKLPPYIEEERFLCAVEILRALCDKLLAPQPAQENLSFTIQTQIRKYLETKKYRRDLTPQAEAEFNRYLEYSPVIRKLVVSSEVDDISPYVKKVCETNRFQTLRGLLLKENRPPLCAATAPLEIARGNVYVSSERFLQVWASLRGEFLPQQHRAYKNAFVKGKYLILLPKEDLINTLTDVSFYPGLDAGALESAVELIEAVYPLMSDEEKVKLLPLTNGPLADKREEIFGLSQKYRPAQQRLTDLFRLTDKNQFETALHTFCALITKDKGGLFFLKYDLAQVNPEELDTLDSVLDRLTDSLRVYFEQQQNTETDLWNYEPFRMMWLLLLIWFRKTFAAAQTAVRSSCSGRKNRCDTA